MKTKTPQWFGPERINKNEITATINGLFVTFESQNDYLVNFRLTKMAKISIFFSAKFTIWITVAQKFRGINGSHLVI